MIKAIGNRLISIFISIHKLILATASVLNVQKNITRIWIFMNEHCGNKCSIAGVTSGKESSIPNYIYETLISTS